MKKAIILHGMPQKREYYNPEGLSASNSNWLPWIAQQLMIRDILAITPEIYEAYKTVWKNWLREIDQYHIDENTMLVGHSCGAGFWLRYLSDERPKLKVGRVILVAPSLGLVWDEADRYLMFEDFELDKNLVKRTDGLTIFNSIDDREGIRRAVKKIRSEVDDVGYREFRRHGHFMFDDMKTNKFPELLEELIN